jgi:hypothetical protein
MPEGAMSGAKARAEAWKRLLGRIEKLLPVARALLAEARAYREDAQDCAATRKLYETEGLSGFSVVDPKGCTPERHLRGTCACYVDLSDEGLRKTGDGVAWGFCDGEHGPDDPCDSCVGLSGSVLYHLRRYRDAALAQGRDERLKDLENMQARAMRAEEERDALLREGLEGRLRGGAK